MPKVNTFKQYYARKQKLFTLLGSCDVAVTWQAKLPSVIARLLSVRHFFPIHEIDDVGGSDILVIKIILVLVLVSFQSNHFYFI